MKHLAKLSNLQSLLKILTGGQVVRGDAQMTNQNAHVSHPHQCDRAELRSDAVPRELFPKLDTVRELPTI